MRILLVASGHSVSTIDVFHGYSAALRAAGHEVRDANLHNWYAYHAVALRAWRWHRLRAALKRRDWGELRHWAEVLPYASKARQAIQHRARIVPEKELIPVGYLPQMASEQIGVEIVKHVPDVVIAVCGLALHKAAFDACWRLGVPMALMLTESPYLDKEQAHRVCHPAVRLAFVNDKTSVLGLKRELTLVADNHRATAETEAGKAQADGMKDAKVTYLPHSFNPEVHYPAEVPGYRTDVYFHGTWWPERRRLLHPLKRWARWHHPRWRVRVGGIWAPVGNQTPRGTRSNATLAEAYRHTRIALNHHRTVIGVEGGKERHVQAAHSLGPRAFEIAACGAFQLCDDARPELGEVFGGSVATYRDADDLREQVAYWLDPAHEQEREDRAWASYQRVQGCTFEARAREIVAPALEGIL